DIGSQFSGNQIVGNFIGTDVSGTIGGNSSGPIVNLGNGTGIVAAYGNSIGGPAPADRNVISGNTSSGIGLVAGNTVENNFLGADVNERPLGNGLATGLGNGVTAGATLDGNTFSKFGPNLIGGTNPDT